MKKCNTCKKLLSTVNFGVHRRAKDGFNHTCKKCLKIYRDKNKTKRSSYDKENYKSNRTKKVLYQKNYYKCNRSDILAYQEAVRNKDSYKLYSYACGINRLYNVSTSFIQSLMDKQKGCCDICNESLVNPWSTSRYHIDHNHITGEVRGLLCSGCNSGIGMLKEDINNLQSAIEYLIKHQNS